MIGQLPLAGPLQFRLLRIFTEFAAPRDLLCGKKVGERPDLYEWIGVMLVTILKLPILGWEAVCKDGAETGVIEVRKKHHESYY